MHRKPPVSFSFGLMNDNASDTLGCVTFGTPASRHMLSGACPSDPGIVLELNRLWVHDDMPKNTESWFLCRALALLPPRIVLSYADTSAGHIGYVYRAANFHYAGWTDMGRLSPRRDYVLCQRDDPDLLGYVSPLKHSRDAYRSGFTERVPRKPKVKYWITTGNRRDRRQLEAKCQWPRMNWKTTPPPPADDLDEVVIAGEHNLAAG